MKINGKALGIAFIVTMGFWAIAWAITTDEIWRNIYDSTNTAIRLNQVAGS